MKKVTAIALAAALLCGMAGCKSEKNVKEGGTPTLKMYMACGQQNDLASVI